MALFRKEQGPAENTLKQIPAAQPIREGRKEKTVTLKADEITTILGKGSEFEGKLHFEGTLQIEGAFSGEIRSDSVLVIGEGARVSAEMDVGTIVINGEVRGNVRAKNGVEIKKPGRLYGNLQTPALTIEKGVIFEGTCKMENPEKSMPPPFEKPPEKKDFEGKK